MSSQKIFMPLVDFKKKYLPEIAGIFLSQPVFSNGIHQDPNTFPKSPLLGAFPTAEQGGHQHIDLTLWIGP